MVIDRQLANPTLETAMWNYLPLYVSPFVDLGLITNGNLC